MVRKTYGVSGLMDWTAQIKVGKGTIALHFTGGALTAYGVTPAKLTTTNPVMQRIIEDSDYFKSGRIELLSTQSDGAAEPRIIAEGKKATATPTKKETAAPSEVKDTAAPIVPEQPKDLQKVETTDLNAAKEYLKEHFGVSFRALRSKKDIVESAKANGVEFVFNE